MGCNFKNFSPAVGTNVRNKQKFAEKKNLATQKILPKKFELTTKKHPCQKFLAKTEYTVNKC